MKKLKIFKIHSALDVCIVGEWVVDWTVEPITGTSTLFETSIKTNGSQDAKAMKEAWRRSSTTIPPKMLVDSRLMFSLRMRKEAMQYVEITDSSELEDYGQSPEKLFIGDILAVKGLAIVAKYRSTGYP
uniref:Peptidase_S24 domain-containing protein n=1 Tax=Caenorhabditis tropicalis TaxID=1561998 RepID=A0A1I7TNZ3_9PELO